MKETKLTLPTLREQGRTRDHSCVTRAKLQKMPNVCFLILNLYVLLSQYTSVCDISEHVTTEGI